MQLLISSLIMVCMVVGLPACVGPSPRPDSASPAQLSRVIDEHTRARGGRVAIERVRSVEIELEIVEPSFTLQGVYVASRQRLMRIDVFDAGKRVYTEAFDGERAWQRGATDAHGTYEKPQGQQALIHGIDGPGNLLGLHELGGHGIALSLLTSENIDGVPYDVIHAKYPDGFATDYYLNRRSHLIERQRDVRALHPDLDAKDRNLEKQFSDFRSVEGRLVAFKEQQVDLKTWAVMQTSTIKSVRINPPLAEQHFRMP